MTLFGIEALVLIYFASSVNFLVLPAPNSMSRKRCSLCCLIKRKINIVWGRRGKRLQDPRKSNFTVNFSTRLSPIAGFIYNFILTNFSEFWQVASYKGRAAYRSSRVTTTWLTPKKQTWFYIPGVHIAQVSLQFSVMYLCSDTQPPFFAIASQPTALLSQINSESKWHRNNYGVS